MNCCFWSSKASTLVIAACLIVSVNSASKANVP
nr:MAG TPA: hypothetical protein [Caudoviricetes sp.]